MVHPVKYGKRDRMSYAKIDEVLEMPNLIEIQKRSYNWFVTEGLQEAFNDISPIEDYTGDLVLEFTGFELAPDPKYSVEEAKERDATYSTSLNAKVQLVKRETGEVRERTVYMGEFPLMTENGTFIINGAERVIVSQLVRSPGVYYAVAFEERTGKSLFSSTVIPNRGAWLEYETDANDIVYARVDRTRKLPITVILRMFGFGSDQEIIDLLGESEQLLKTLEKDTTSTEEEGLLEVYKRLRPGEPPTVESAKSLINSLFFEFRRYDLAKVGRYKFNKKLALSTRITGLRMAETLADPNTGEILVEEGDVVSKAQAAAIEAAGIHTVHVKVEDRTVKVIGNQFVDPSAFGLSFDMADFGLRERIYYPAMKELMEQAETEDELKELIGMNIRKISPRQITIADIISTINYEFNLFEGIGNTDDIDHLGNRRVRSVGELLQNQFRIGLSRMERVVKERMTIQDGEGMDPQALINIRPVSAAIKEFFGSSQLSQFMDQNNPLAELTNKRRMSALGPGGLSRDRAGFEVRDVHHSHYGRMCPIESPEGPNIGLISSLATFARINEYGFIETPYRRVDKAAGALMGDIDYLTADVEDRFIIAQANEPLDENGAFVNSKVSVRAINGAFDAVDPHQVDYMDVSPRQVVSVATAMIPFLENDDANRALMGANMQRQAVPLLVTEAPVIGTGMEHKAAFDSGVVKIAKEAGVVERVDANRIIVRRDVDGAVDVYKLTKFKRSNQGTCMNQRPIVQIGEVVKKGTVLADGPSTDQGELGLGKNLLIGFMTWEGYNYEDAILLNENLVKNDVLTSVHIEE
jgi:DNA-directed RNA polymerase subunit beta